MKKTILSLGVAALALSAVNVTDAEAGRKGFKHHHKHHWAFHDKHYWHKPYKCFWIKKKHWHGHSWHWKKVRICKPWHRF